MQLRLKIILPLCLLLALLISTFTYVLWYSFSTQNDIEKDIESIQKINDLSSQINLLRQDIENDVISYRYTKDKKLIEKVDLNRNEISQLLSELNVTVSDPTARELLTAYSNTREGLMQTRKELSNAIEKNDTQKIDLFYTAWEVKSENSYAALIDFDNYSLHLLETSRSLYSSLLNRIIILLAIISCITVLFIIILYFYLRQIVTHPILRLSSSASKIAEGKFGMPIVITSNDELGMLSQDLNTMSQKLKEYYDHLRNEVRQKEEEIRRVREFEAQKDDFMSIASHELKTPVTSLKLYGQLMEQTARKLNHQQYDKYLTKMNEQVYKLTGLITDLLDVTKIQTGKLPLHKDYYDLNASLQDSVELAQATTTKHKIFLKGRLNKKLFADKNRISQVVDNLISNAIKYSPEGGNVIVSVSNNPKEVRISIKDSGIGIDKKNQEKIFDRFFRVTSKDEKTFPGLGIGLYICSEIIQRHDGKIFVESKRGKGSTFTVTLPYKSS